MKAHDGILAVDCGTGGLTVGLYEPESNQMAGFGNGSYEHLDNRADSRWLEQDPREWIRALRDAMAGLRREISGGGRKLEDIRIAGIGIGGHMHAAIFLDANGETLGGGGKPPVGAIMWNDPRGEEEAAELSALWGEPIPARLTASRIRWFSRHRPELWQKTGMIAIPSAYVGFALTGVLGVGPGDGSGMFGQLTKDGLSSGKLAQIDPALPGKAVPRIGAAGEVMGRLSERGAQILGLPQGVPVCFPEGDQPVGMVASGVVSPGQASVSLGNSVVFNCVGAEPVLTERGVVDSFRTANSRHLLMTCVTSGCTVLDTLVRLFAAAARGSQRDMLIALDREAAAAPSGSGGLTFLPFLGGEGIFKAPNATGALAGMTHDNLTAGNLVRAFFEATAASMRLGKTRMGNFDLTEIVISGGGSQSVVWPQIVADVFGAAVRKPQDASEAATRGAAYLALLMARQSAGEPAALEQVLAEKVRLTDPILPSAKSAEMGEFVRRFERAVTTGPSFQSN